MMLSLSKHLAIATLRRNEVSTSCVKIRQPSPTYASMFPMQ